MLIQFGYKILIRLPPSQIIPYKAKYKISAYIYIHEKKIFISIYVRRIPLWKKSRLPFLKSESLDFTEQLLTKSRHRHCNALFDRRYEILPDLLVNYKRQANNLGKHDQKKEFYLSRPEDKLLCETLVQMYRF